jgi:hypothetical protein
MRKYLLKNSVTGKYWDGRPAPFSFDATRENAKMVDGGSAAFLKASYANVVEETYFEPYSGPSSFSGFMANSMA